MANDIDLWNDIETLEKSGAGDPVHVKALHTLFRLRYVDYDGSPKCEAELQKFKDYFQETFGYLPNV